MAKNRKKEARGQTAAAPPEKERVPGWVLWPLFFFWGLFVFRNHYGKFTPDLNSLFIILSPQQYSIGGFGVLAGHAFNLLCCLAFLFSCYTLGRLCLRLGGFSFLNALEEAFFAAAAGLGLFAMFVVGLGASGLLYAWAVAAPLLALFAFGVYDLARRPPAPGPFDSVRPGSPQAAQGKQFWPAGLAWTDSAALALLLFAMLFNLAGALGPEIFYDSLVYHLAVPGFYAIKHKIAEMPYNIYSAMPLTHSMLYTAALLVKDAILAKLINYSALVLSAAAVMAAGARFFSWRAGLWGALIFYTVFHTMATSWTAGTEALLTCFSVAALYAVLNHKDEEKKWLWLAACFAGLAMGVKYTGIFPAVGVMLAYAYKALRPGSGQARKTPLAAVKDLALFTLIASLFVAPWLLKNYLYKGNPVYPMATGVFALDADSDPAKVEGLMGETRQMGALHFKDWVQHPWTVTMGKAGNSEYFSPLFLFLLPLIPLLALSGPCAGGALCALWIYFLTVWLTWSCASTMVRFLMPAYPAAGLLIGHYLFTGGHKALKAALKVVVLLTCLAGVYWALLVFYSQGRYKPVLGQISQEEYLSHTEPTYPFSQYAAIQFINNKLPADAKTLIVGDGRSFYMKKDFIVSSVFDKTPAVEYAAASKDGGEMYARMKADGLTHLLLNVAEAVKLGKGYRMFYFDDRSLAVFNQFWAAHVKEVFSSNETQPDGQIFNRTAVYELLPARDPKEPPPYNFMNEVIMKAVNAK